MLEHSDGSLSLKFKKVYYTEIAELFEKRSFEFDLKKDVPKKTIILCGHSVFLLKNVEATED